MPSGRFTLKTVFPQTHLSRGILALGFERPIANLGNELAGVLAGHDSKVGHRHRVGTNWRAVLEANVPEFRSFRENPNPSRPTPCTSHFEPAGLRGHR